MLNYKADFPLLNQFSAQGKQWVYLDSAASSQLPQCVIDTINDYYQYSHANIHRGVYELSERATQHYEAVRKQIKKFIHAPHTHEIVFVRGATEGINLVAQSFGRTYFKAGDEVIISTMEHHSNIVPWQMLSEQCGIKLQIIPMTDEGEIELAAYSSLFSPRTKMVALIHASNVLGTVNPIKKMIDIAHQHEVPVLIDGAQAFPHLPVNVQELDCDFYVFSAHKAYGPTGVGVLYGKTKWLEKMPPYQGGGDMIESVSFKKTTYNKLPYKFEAGTPNIAGVIGFGEAIHYLETIGWPTIVKQESDLLNYATEHLAAIPGLTILGTNKNKIGVISFTLEDVHPHDIGTILNHEGIAIRAGHHCAMPLMERLAISACARASLGLYNSTEDIDQLVVGLENVKRIFH